MKKVIALLLSMVCAAGTMVSCSKADDGFDGILTHNYNYDLSEYIDLAEYKGLSAEGYRYEVTDEMVEEQILATRSFYSRLTDVERGAQIGDTVYIDYVGTIDGAEFEGGSETDCELTLGTGTFPDEFEDAILGATAETELSVDFTFPDPYLTAPEYSGMDVHFDIHVHTVCEQELPEYNEDFVRGYLGYDSIADFEAGLRQLLADRYQNMYYQYVNAQVWNTVYENTTVKKFPEDEIRKQYDEVVEAEKYYAGMQGINFADYIGVNYQMTEDEYYAFVQEEVEKRIKREMICYAIARAENITLTEEEYKKRATEYALDYYGLDSLEAFETVYSHGSICQMLMFDKVHEVIVDYAEITYLND
ncbi:MAG: trigger factor [Clostridia bacterium]|nr:trigger factor [Clostridia bacterium]